MAENPSYEVILGPAAKRFVLEATERTRSLLADCLKVELKDGPNAHAASSVEINGLQYIALPLSCGIVAVHRPLTHGVLEKLRRQLGRRNSHGYLVADLLHPRSGISGTVPKLGG